MNVDRLQRVRDTLPQNLNAGILLGERLDGTQWAGAALIIGAAFVLASTSEKEDGIGPVDAPLPALGETAGDQDTAASRCHAGWDTIPVRCSSRFTCRDGEDEA